MKVMTIETTTLARATSAQDVTVDIVPGLKKKNVNEECNDFINILY